MRERLYVATPWYYVKKWGRSVHAGAKCGGQTLLVALLNDHGIEDPGMNHRRTKVHGDLCYWGDVEISPEPKPDMPAYQFIRHPAARFESCWRNKCRDVADDKWPHHLKGVSPDALLDWLMEVPLANAHWRPQVVDYRKGNFLRPIIAMKDLPGCPRAPVNSTVGLCAPYDKEKLLKFYAADVKLYDRALEEYYG